MSFIIGDKLSRGNSLKGMQRHFYIPNRAGKSTYLNSLGQSIQYENMINNSQILELLEIQDINKKIYWEICTKVSYKCFSDVEAHKNAHNMGLINRIKNDIQSESVIIYILAQLHLATSKSAPLFKILKGNLIRRINSRKRLNLLNMYICNLRIINYRSDNPIEEIDRKLWGMEESIKDRLKDLENNSVHFLLQDEDDHLD